MIRLPLSAALAIAGVCGSASGQNTFVYEFQLEVTSNAVAENLTEGYLASLEVGTPGMLRVVLTAEPGDYPDWNSETLSVHDIVEVSLTVGGVTSHGLSGTYPTSSPFSGLHFANDVWHSFPQQTRLDSFSAFLGIDHPEIGGASFVLNEISEPNQFPLLFSSLELPTSANLNMADSRQLSVGTTLGESWHVRFSVVAFEGRLVPSCVADVDGNGDLTPADFGAWITAFNTQSPACDQNDDGACSPADFGAWITNFNAGC